MVVRVTFSLDEETVRQLRATSESTKKPQSLVVREAVAEYAARVGRLSDAERLALLRTFDRLVPALPARPTREVDAELRDLRSARRHGGRQRGTR